MSLMSFLNDRIDGGAQRRRRILFLINFKLLMFQLIAQLFFSSFHWISLLVGWAEHDGSQCIAQEFSIYSHICTSYIVFLVRWEENIGSQYIARKFDIYSHFKTSYHAGAASCSPRGRNLTGALFECPDSNR